MSWKDWREDVCQQDDDDCACCPPPKPVVRLPIAPSNRVKPPGGFTGCCCTPETCICKTKKESK